MSSASLIYPHQLIDPLRNPVLERSRPVYMIEEPLLLTYNPAHRQRLLLNRLSMQTYARELRELGFEVHYIDLRSIESAAEVWQHLADDGIRSMHVADTSDNYLEKAFTAAARTHGIERIWYESPLFLLPRAESIQRYLDSKRHMARFYQQLRRDWRILVSEDGLPLGDAWSFDQANRKKLPKDIHLPPDIQAHSSQGESSAESQAIEDALSWLSQIGGEQYGEAEVWIGWTRTTARQALDSFLTERFADFGAYEDALTSRHTRVFHSSLSPLINIGLLQPREVLDAAIAHADRVGIPINSLEGFVRQILGWREFMRAAYEQDGCTMRSSNTFGHSRQLPPAFWTGRTGIPPIDLAVKNALQYGYNHHIERLMVHGNFMLLTETDPNEVYRWFMGMYLDAYDWVMVPNVYGMSQFADGGLFATKPYISGSNYLRKMSDYPSGPWEETWTALYWHFIHRHRRLFESNHRMAMMPRMLDKMKATTRAAHLQRAVEFLSAAPDVS
ncbi:cryptochrome/photolyase family protein [Spirochaeta dissipatitropha]